MTGPDPARDTQAGGGQPPPHDLTRPAPPKPRDGTDTAMGITSSKD